MVSDQTSGRALLLYRRWLSRNELDILNRDPLAPFRQRRSIPFGVTSAPETPTAHRSPGVVQTNIIKPNLEVDWNDPLNKGLVAWWPFNQKGGNVLRDVAGDNHVDLEASMTSDDWVVSPETGAMALDFDGIDDRLNTGIDAVSWSQVTLSYWFWSEAGSQPDSYAEPVWSQGNQVGFYQGNRVNNLNARLKTENGTVDVGLSPDRDFNTGGWHHVAMTWDGQTVRTYKDATFISDANLAGSITGPGQFTIAGRGLNYFKGKITDVRIYDRGLSGSEIHDLYQASRTGYVNQFKRRSFSIAATPTMLERIRSRSKPVAAKTITIKHNETPSYKAGYAKSASESANPNLWDGLHRAWVPMLGQAKDIPDVASKSTALQDTSAHSWGPTYVSKTGVGDSSRFLIDPIGYAGVATFYFRVRVNSDTGQTARLYEFGTNDYCYLTDGFTFKVSGALLTKYIHPLGEWLDLFLVPTGSDVFLYCNGELVASTTSNQIWDAGGDGALFNAVTTTSRSPDCDVASVCFWKRALSLNEMAQIHADPLAPFRKKTLTIGYQPNKDLRGLIRIS